MQGLLAGDYRSAFEVLGRALEKNPDVRFQNIASVQRKLG